MYGIFTPLWNFRLPFGHSKPLLLSVRDAFCLSGRTHGERIFNSGVCLLEICKSTSSISPLTVFTIVTYASHGALPAGNIIDRCADPAAVVVHHDFIHLCVPLSWNHHISPGIFQHWSQVLQDETLGEHVFAGLEQAWTLPFPTVELLLIISSVALPQGYMRVVKPFVYLDFRVKRGDDGRPVVSSFYLVL